MGWVLDGLDTESYDRTYRDRDLLKRIVSYFKPQSKKLAAVALLLFAGSLASAAGPVLVSKAIDFIAAQPGLLMIVAAGAALSALGALSWLVDYLHERKVSEAVGDVVLAIRRDVFARAVAHDLSFFDEHPSGKIVARIAADTQDFSNIVTLVTDLASQFLMVLLLTAWLVSINPVLTLLLIVMAPAAGGIALLFRRIARKVTQNAKRANAEINSQIQESISGIVVAKTFRKESSLFDTFLVNNRLSYRVGLSRGFVLNTIFPVMGISAGLGNALLAHLGGSLAVNGAMSLGNWYLFMQAVGFYWWPMLNIASFWSQFQGGLAAAERVFALIDREPRVHQSAGDPIRAAGDGQDGGAWAVEFRNVHFAYNDKERVLDDFSLVIRPEESLAVVGHTGAGKSSLARLVARFYEFQAGQILVDGKDLRSLDLDAYRRHLGYVPQDPFLFTGTVAENIRYGRLEATDEEVAYAASHVGRGDWLADLPEGLASKVGERGSAISFGQRQLVALARVLLKDPSLFILDEATASVDPFTETQIQEGLNSVMRNRTAIIIAHRLSTVKHADRIIVLDRGRILEEGSHESLLNSGGHYAELYNTYFRHQSLEYVERAREV